MTTQQLSDACGFRRATGDGTREVRGLFSGDLLSWVMGRAGEGDAWFTVMGNVNAVAVAALADCACAVLCHGAQWDEAAVEKARQQGVELYVTDLPEFEAGLAAAKALGL